MTEPNAVILSRGGSDRPISTADIVSAVRAGEVVVVPQALQHVGFHRELVETTLHAIRDVCSTAEADQCRRIGLEKLHEVLDGPQIEKVVHATEQRLEVLYARLMKALGHVIFGLNHAFYIHYCPLLRFMVPHESATSNRALFSQRENRGRLSGHPPHRDYWYRNPINSFNVWIALGAVKRENGLLIYTDMWGKDVKREGKFAPEGDLYGVPLTFALNAGDVALFDNRHLHASAVNVTPYTRVVYSGRLCTERPIAARADSLETTTFWSPLVGTPLERFAGAATKMSWTYVIERLKRRATSAVATVERRVGWQPLQRVRAILRYRRADYPFGA